MTNKTTKSEKQTHSTDYLNLLEYKIQQDRIAYKKVIKWATTIQNRIEQTQRQLEDLKKYIPKTSESQKNVEETLCLPQAPIPLDIVFLNQEETTKLKEIEAKTQYEETRPNEIKISNVSDQTFHTIAHTKQIDENNSIIRNCTCTYGQTNVYTIGKKLKNFEVAIDKRNNCQEIKKKENEPLNKIAEERLEALLDSIIDEKLSTFTKKLNCQENELLGLKVDVADKMKDLYKVKQDITKMHEKIFEIDNMVNGVENSISKTHSEIKELVNLLLNTNR